MWYKPDVVQASAVSGDGRRVTWDVLKAIAQAHACEHLGNIASDAARGENDEDSSCQTKAEEHQVVHPSKTCPQ